MRPGVRSGGAVAEGVAGGGERGCHKGLKAVQSPVTSATAFAIAVATAVLPSSMGTTSSASPQVTAAWLTTADAQT